MSKILAWHGDPDLKAAAVARMRAHREADTFIQGSYFRHDPEAARGYRGCFHGCLTTEALAAEQGVNITQLRGPVDWIADAQQLFGIPYLLGVLLDDVFESQPTFAEAGDFAVRATEAIPVGADLSGVHDAIVEDPEFDEDTDTVVKHLAAAPIPALDPAGR